MGQCPTPKPDPQPCQPKFEQFQTLNTLAEIGPPDALVQNVCGYRNIADFAELEKQKVANKCDTTNSYYWVRTEGDRFFPSAMLPECGSQPIDQSALGTKPITFACSSTARTYPKGLVKPL